MRYFIELSYKGTNYNGWQRQTDAPSVQGTLENYFSLLLRTQTEITGAGRTDTGVHASFYVAHFDIDNEIPSTDDFVYHINKVLPADIAVHRLYAVEPRAHARFDALEREYKYYIIHRKDPFRTDTAWLYTSPLDADAMNRAAHYLTQFDDFTSFGKLHSANKTNICNVTHARWISDGRESVFTIRSDRFLRNMVRALVGTMWDVGRGKISPERFGEILHARDLSLSSASAPPQGLFLTDVKYKIHV